MPRPRSAQGKKPVNLSLDAKLTKDAQQWAAQHATNLSALVERLLRKATKAKNLPKLPA